MAPIAIQYTTSKADIRRAALGSLTQWLRSQFTVLNPYFTLSPESCGLGSKSAA